LQDWASSLHHDDVVVILHLNQKPFKNFVIMNMIVSRSPDSEGFKEGRYSVIPHTVVDFQHFVCSTVLPQQTKTGSII
jgi:hypothetical protein